MSTRKAVLVTIVALAMLVVAAFAMRPFVNISEPDAEETPEEEPSGTEEEAQDVESPDTEETADTELPSVEGPKDNSDTQDEESGAEESPEPTEEAEEATEDESGDEEEATEEEDHDPEHPDIRVTNIDSGDGVSSPLVVKGEARGTWFFEGDFPLILTDWNGRIIAEGYATAKGDWMTEDFVEFEGVLDFVVPEYGERGFLILQKDNPTGLPEHDDAIEIEVYFASVGESDTVTVRIYFTTEQAGTDTCEATEYVERKIPKTVGVGRAVLEQLLMGPTEEEKEAGYTTSIDSKTELQSLHIDNGTAYVDFNEALDRDVGGSCLVTAIYTQIANTLKQFSTVDDVVISINGETEEALQP